jgi:hypothetical protein
MYIHAYKKYRASPLTDKKKSNSVRRRKKISSKLKIYQPPHQKSNGPSLRISSFVYTINHMHKVSFLLYPLILYYIIYACFGVII